MNTEILNTRIRHFQAARDLQAMGECAWQLACDLAETGPEKLTEISQVSRSSWILPMLSFAKRMLMQKSIEYVADLEQQTHLAGALSDEIGQITPDFRYKCEISMFNALFRFDEVAVVHEYLKEFFGPKNLIFVKWKPTLESIAWLPAGPAQEHLEQALPHIRTALQLHCPWWTAIAAHGQTSDPK